MMRCVRTITISCSITSAMQGSGNIDQFCANRRPQQQLRIVCEMKVVGFKFRLYKMLCCHRCWHSLYWQVTPTNRNIHAIVNALKNNKMMSISVHLSQYAGQNLMLVQFVFIGCKCIKIMYRPAMSSIPCCCLHLSQVSADCFKLCIKLCMN